MSHSLRECKFSLGPQAPAPGWRSNLECALPSGTIVVSFHLLPVLDLPSMLSLCSVTALQEMSQQYVMQSCGKT